MSMWARLTNKGKVTQRVPDLWAILSEHFIVTDEAGRKLPYVGTRPAWANDRLGAHVAELKPGQIIGSGFDDIGRAYSMQQPGAYRITVQYPLDPEGRIYVESAAVEILVVPAGSLVAELRRLPAGPVTTDRAVIPVQLTLRCALEPEEVKVERISFSGRDVWGVPEGRAPARVHTLAGKVTEFGFDLGAAKWAKHYSSIWPSQDIWSLGQPGEKWSVTASVRGLYRGKEFALFSNAVEVEVPKAPAATRAPAR